MVTMVNCLEMQGCTFKYCNHGNDPKSSDGSGQTEQIQIRLLLYEQSDQGLHCLLFNLHDFDKIPSGLAFLFEI